MEMTQLSMCEQQVSKDGLYCMKGKLCGECDRMVLRHPVSVALDINVA